MESHPYRWRFNMRTGPLASSNLDDRVLEFGTINGGNAGLPYRYTYTVTGKPGWFLFNGLVKLDLHSGPATDSAFPDGVFASEAPMAPRLGATAEDDGYLLTFTTDMNNDRSECLIFAAQDLGAGPIASIGLPQRICSGTHASWAPIDQLR